MQHVSSIPKLWNHYQSEQSCAPWGSFIIDRAPLDSDRSNSSHIDPLWGLWLVQHVSSISSIPKLGFSSAELCSIGLVRVWKSPIWFIEVEINLHRPFVVCLVGAACLGCSNGAACPQHLQLNRLAYSWSRFVPHGAYFCMTEPQLVLIGRIHPTSTLCWVFSRCSMPPASSC